MKVLAAVGLNEAEYAGVVPMEKTEKEFAPGGAPGAGIIETTAVPFVAPWQIIGL